MKRNEVYRVLGSRIRAARLQRAMTQEALGRAAHRTRSQIINIEYGRACPALWTLLCIADALQMEAHLFLLPPGKFPLDTKFIRNERPLNVWKLILE